MPSRALQLQLQLQLQLLLALLVLATPARAGEPPVVAVFNLEQRRLELSAPVLQSLSDYLAAQLAASGAFRVVPRDRLKRALTRQRKASYRACYSQSCQIEIGQELAAQKSLSSQILKLGGKCVVTSTLYDLRRATTDRAATAEGGCGEAALVASLRAVTGKLAGGVAESPASRPAPAAASTGQEGAPIEPGLTRGPAGAPISIEEFTDYECPFCRRSHLVISALFKKFPGKLRRLHRDYPLDESCNPRVRRGMHPMACLAAYYARCAAAQGKFAALDDSIFAEEGELTEEKLRRLARRARLDAGQLERCLSSPRVRRAVLTDIALAANLGITGTPVVFVNGEKVLGWRPAEWWESKLRSLLGR